MAPQPSAEGRVKPTAGPSRRALPHPKKLGAILTTLPSPAPEAQNNQRPKTPALPTNNSFTKMQIVFVDTTLVLSSRTTGGDGAGEIVLYS